MGGRVVKLPRAVSGLSEYLAVRPDDDGANRHFSAHCGSASLGKGNVHVALGIGRCHKHATFFSIDRRLVPKVPSANHDSNKGPRIAKAMARAGLCSRREAERWIADGRVSVNGKLLKTPAFEVTPKDKVLVDGKPLPANEPPRLWRYHKPKGLVTTHADPQERPTVFQKLPPEMPRVVSIGRLDFNTEGLLLLTNDGALARYMELPATGWTRRYRVRAKGRVTPSDLEKLKTGLEIDDVRYGPVEATVDSVQGANIWLTIAIREGKNREVRKIAEHLGLTVNRLIRVSFGPFQLRDLAPGAVEAVKRRTLVEQLGAKFAQELGLSESAEDRKARHARGKAAASRGDDE